MQKSSILVLLCILCYSIPTQAYNRDTHQHITELAYSYLKLMSMCEPVEHSNTEFCKDDCKKDLESNGFSEGYSCSCLSEICGNRNGCSNEANGYQQYLCVEDCISDTAEGRDCVERLNCPLPRYFHSDWEGEIVDDICGRECRDSTTISLPDRCEAFERVFESPNAGSMNAGDTVRFFQNFSATPCPLGSYSYHGVGHCAGREATTTASALVDLRLSPKPLIDWTQAAGENYRLGSSVDSSEEGGEFRRN